MLMEGFGSIYTFTDTCEGVGLALAFLPEFPVFYQLYCGFDGCFDFYAEVWLIFCSAANWPRLVAAP